ncbi:unnamed protein product [Rhizophagus irregularis]|nr:unnamed protein product [Rhizophagus irregularis]
MSDGKNETCVEPCINDYILRQDPQVAPLGCYVFNNNLSIDTFNDFATLNNPSSPGLSFPCIYNNQIIFGEMFSSNYPFLA